MQKHSLKTGNYQREKYAKFTYMYVNKCIFQHAFPSNKGIRRMFGFCKAKKDIVLYYYISAHVSSVVSFINRLCTAVEDTIRIKL